MNRRSAVSPFRFLFTLQTPMMGCPVFLSLARCSASAPWGASSVTRNRMRSASLAASCAVSASSSPPKAATPGTSVIFSPFHS